MNYQQHKWWSPNLGQDMELRVYGHDGKPFLIFPCQEGRFYEFHDFGMVDICRPWLEAGKLQVITVDSVDAQSWCNPHSHPHDRALRHDAYDRYLTEEVVPFIREFNKQPMGASGCSMGGYHSANYFFRHPDICDSLIALSGLYNLRLFIGDYMDDAVFYHTPLAYLPGLTDPWYLDRFRKSQIFVAVGQGAWEEPMIEDTFRLKQILEEKQVPAFIDFWGYDVNHDWAWWHKMMPYFLDKMNL
jgi:esterase/lipase superfamily enzyme